MYAGRKKYDSVTLDLVNTDAASPHIAAVDVTIEKQIDGTTGYHRAKWTGELLAGEAKTLTLLLDYLAVACLAAAVALLLDELWDGRTHPEHGLRWRDLLNPRSHEFVIALLTATGTLFFALSLV